jgi:hypothetical protein
VKIKEAEITDKIAQKAKALFEDKRFIEVLSADELKQEIPADNRRADFEMNVKLKNGKKYRIVFEVKSVGQPRYVRSAVNQLQSYLNNGKNSYGIVGAPYFSEESINICRGNNMGCVDLAGNCYIEFDDIFIQVKGNPNPFMTARPQKSLFAAKSTRILRVLLCQPGKKWRMAELAKEAEVSLGQTANVKKKLLDDEYIMEDESKRIVLKNPDALLKKWAAIYSYRQNKIYNFYSLDTPQQVEQKISEYCHLNNIKYAFTLTTGADIVNPFLRYRRAFLYLKPENINAVSRDLRWKPVETGPNITVLEPYDEGVFYGVQDIQGKKVVSDIQLYLDLQSYKERGGEAAEQIYEKRIKLKW